MRNLWPRCKISAAQFLLRIVTCPAKTEYRVQEIAFSAELFAGIAQLESHKDRIFVAAMDAFVMSLFLVKAPPSGQTIVW